MGKKTRILEEVKKKKRKISVWKLVLIDTVALAISMGTFMLFYYILPKQISTGTVVYETDETNEITFELPNKNESSVTSETTEESDTSGDKESITTNSSHRGERGSRESTSNSNTTDITSSSSDVESINSNNINTTVLQNVSNDTTEFTISKKEFGSDEEKVTYYVADIYVASIRSLRTAFAEGDYGKNIKDTVLDMANENNAILAISGDFYGNSEEGVVIRNGVLYRSELNNADICVLFTDGSMRTYTAEEFNGEEVIKQGAWQAWTFGPALLDGSGNVLSSFNSNSYINSDNPRCAIGCIAAGHYIWVVVDGRNEGYSRGVTLSELASIMASEGCISAYNLDGGKSSAMVYNGEYINEPADGGREISDIIYIGN